MSALPLFAVLRANGSALVFDCRGPRAPRILHWGADLGNLDESQLTSLAHSQELARGHSAFDQPQPVSITRDSGEGFFGTPGLMGHRSGKDFSNRFELLNAVLADNRVEFTLRDADAGVELRATFDMHASGALRITYALTNAGTADYTLDDLNIALPLPQQATQLTDFTGNWSREKSPQTRNIEAGTWSREVREGRTGHDYTLSFNAHTASATFQTGEVWSLSLGWSGNTRHFVEKLTDASVWIGASELLLPGEIVLAPGATYSTPVLYAAYSSMGFDGAAAVFHDYLRARPQHPKRPRPLTINVWEAVYFDHRFDKLAQLADVAASIGVERFVLDDGWFGSRRDDNSGLGDWVVSSEMWPEGLHPLARKLQEVGIEFGLWFEPEMIQIDSDAYRAHPEWLLSVGDRLPGAWRNQQVIDLANPAAYAHVFGQIDAILREYPTITYIKWDHNRVLIDGSHDGRATVHAQTAALYRLLDELKVAHPGLEIESCASGGGRIDLGILDHTDRVWVSDTNDALERQRMQRWTGQVLPPELMGSHIGPHHAHTSGRTHDLGFRAITALFCHAGLEWDITTTTDAEREVLRSWAAYYKANRDLLHHGRMVRVDHPNPAMSVHGVVANDCSRAIFAVVQEGVSVSRRPLNTRFPGLDPDRIYVVEEVMPAGGPQLWQQGRTPWTTAPLRLSGRVLAEVGVVTPILQSEQACLIEISADQFNFS